jgi:hypothetical protein
MAQPSISHIVILSRRGLIVFKVQCGHLRETPAAAPKMMKSLIRPIEAVGGVIGQSETIETIETAK